MSTTHEPVHLPQWSATTILTLWAVVTAPMGVLAWVVVPRVIPMVDLHPGLVHWMAMVVGMMWQFVVSLVMLRREGAHTRADIARRIRADRSSGVGLGRRLWGVALLGVLINVVLGFAAGPLDTLWERATGVHAPWYTDIQALADPQFVGAWWIVGLALVSALFNYVLGEELFFRGLLLPRMAGAFGRWDAAANTVLFGLYHVHKFWMWPSMILSSFGIAWAAKKTRSFWAAVLVHGVEGVFVILVLAIVAGWWMPPA